MSNTNLVNAINHARRAQSSNQTTDSKIEALAKAIEEIAQALRDIESALKIG